MKISDYSNSINPPDLVLGDQLPWNYNQQKHNSNKPLEYLCHLAESLGFSLHKLTADV